MSAAQTKSWGRNLAERLLTAAAIVPLILWLLFSAPKIGFVLLAVTVGAIAASELMVMTIPESRALRVWGVLATIGMMGTILYAPEGAGVLTATLVLVSGGLLGGLLAPIPPERAGHRIAWLIAGPMYVGTMLASVPLLHQRPEGGAWVVLCMMLAWFGDTGAYFFGRFFGNRKLYPEVSPSKTIEGSIGGLLGSLLGAMLAHFWYLPVLPLVDGILLALVAGALGQSGDLAESLIKRSTGVKDSGRILPGHGGLLDRIDALVFTGTATWIYATWILGAPTGIFP